MCYTDTDTGAPTYERRETLLKITGVRLTLSSREQGTNLILRNVNAHVENVVRPGMSQGQVVGLLGPSGVGKTQLLRIIAGLQQPDEGTVLVGKEQRPVEAGMVGVVAQHYPLFMHRRVLGNLVVAGRQAGLTYAGARAKAWDLLKRFKLDDRGRFFPAQLSGGQRQRVAIAQQFMCSDHFVIMDEPFSGLDPPAVRRVCGLINEIAALDELNTIFVITHDISAAIQVADTLWLMGRDRDAKGDIIPGAYIKREIDLIERGLAWHKDITTLPAFYDVFREVSGEFDRL